MLVMTILHNCFSVQFSGTSKDEDYETIFSRLIKKMETLIIGLLVRLKKKEPHDDIITHMRSKPVEQLQQYLIELIVLSLESCTLRKLLVDLSQDVDFYCRSRYMLAALTSSQTKGKPRKEITDFQNQLDNSFVNFNQLMLSQHLATEELWGILSIEKQQRSEFIQNRNELFGSLRTLSEQLKELRDKEVQGTTLFSNSISHINHYLREMNCKRESDQFDCSRVIFKNKSYFMEQIKPEGSTYLKTKNRCPLLLNLEFGRFMFKVDTLLQNQLVAREITKFLIVKLPFIQFISFDIVPLPCGGALYEFVEATKTVSDCKKQADGLLKTYFAGWEHSEHNIRLFALSLAGFAIQQYVLQLKDRHNQNIMINNRGEILHIDLSYIYNCKLPWGLETVPFKLPKQYIDLMGCFQSDHFHIFQNQLVKAFTILSEHIDQLILKIEILKRMPELKCFENFSVDQYRKCFPKPNDDIVKFVERIITNSYDNWRIRKYDSFQFKSNGIFA